MRKISSQAVNLYNALIERNIKCELEHFDGYKHIDITIPWAKIDIEVDGLHHYTKPEQILSDFKRSFWSLNRDDYDTFHVPNVIVDKYLNSVADAIASVARSQYEIIQFQKKHPLISFFQLLLRKLKGRA